MILFTLLSLSFVSANENVTDSPDDVSNSFSVITYEKSNLQDHSDNFTVLNDEISNSQDTVELSKNYSYISGEKKININKSLTVNGNNNFIDCNNQSELFLIEDNLNITFKNVSFINTNQSLFKFANKNIKANIAFVDCPFTGDGLNHKYIMPEDKFTGTSYVYKVTSKIKKLTKKVVGKSTGVKAAKKIASWINKNIMHEKGKGFYQSPVKTLKLKKGNCCCHSELFVVMCDAIGLTKNHKIGIVHCGLTKVKYRHFLNVFDNTLLDCDCKYSNPWGKAGSLKKRGLCRVTLYPVLPIDKTY